MKVTAVFYDTILTLVQVRGESKAWRLSVGSSIYPVFQEQFLGLRAFVMVPAEIQTSHFLTPNPQSSLCNGYLF